MMCLDVFRCLLLCSLISLPAVSSTAQTWRELTLPKKFERILFAGDMEEPASLVLWGIDRVVTSGDVRTEFWSFYKSTNAGVTWKGIDAGRYTSSWIWDQWTAREVRINRGRIVRTSGYCWMGCESRLELSEGGGAFRELVHLVNSDDEPANDDETHFASDGSLYRTFFDGGEYRARRDSLNLVVLRRGPWMNSWFLHADSAGGTFHAPRDVVFTTHLAFHYRNPGTMILGTFHGLFRWQPGRAGWSRLTTGLSLDSGWVQTLTSHPSDPSLWYASTSSRFNNRRWYRSVDSARSWESILTPDPLNTPVSTEGALAITHMDADLLVMWTCMRGESPDSVYLSLDRGTSWRNITGTLVYNNESRSRMHVDLTALGLRVYLPLQDRVLVCDDVLAALHDPPPPTRRMECSIHPQPLQAGGPASVTIRATPGLTVHAAVFDALGRKVASLPDAQVDETGSVSLPIQSEQVGIARGVYFLRVAAADASECVRLLVQ